MSSFHHLALTCHDMLAMERFYTEQFGFRRARTFNPGQANEFLMLRLGSLCLELFQSTKAEPSQRGGEQPIGFRHMAFEVPDMQAAVAKLKAAGVEPDRIIDAGKHVPGLTICFFRDPEATSSS